MKKYIVFFAVVFMAAGCAVYAFLTLTDIGGDGTGKEAPSIKNVEYSDDISDKDKNARLSVSIRGTDMVLHGTWEDTELAKEIYSHRPMEVRLVNWHGREFYGSMAWQPEATGEGHRTFEEGDVTYCPQNNSIAIFYDKSREPNLTMDVIVIGHIEHSDIAKLHKLGDEVTMLFE